MKNKKEIELLKEIILSRKELIKDYKLMGFFGSCLNSKDFFDIDLISIGKNKTHTLLKKEIKKELSKYPKKVIFFKSVKNEPTSKRRNEILIHDLHYSNLKNLYNKEWKDVINEIKLSSKVIYGSKNIIKFQEVDESYFYSLWLKWVMNIKSKKSYDNYKKYMLKIIPLLYHRHPKLKLKYTCNKIISVFNKKEWKESQKEIKNILRKKLKGGSKTL